MKRCIVIIAVMLVGCSHPSVPVGLIVKTGTYPSPSGPWVLDVSRGEKTLIQYAIKNVETNIAFRPEHDFSNVHRWAFFWESNSRLWCHSSDIGTSLWIHENNGTWTQHWLTPDSKYNQEIPEPLFQYLPSSLKRRMKETGGSNQ